MNGTNRQECGAHIQELEAEIKAHLDAFPHLASAEVERLTLLRAARAARLAEYKAISRKSSG